MLLGHRVSAATRPAGQVIQTAGPVALEDVAGDERLLEGEPLLGQCAAYLGVPLRGSEGEPAGVLAVCSVSPREWREEEIGALTALAANASAALSNAELYQQVALERETSLAILGNVADGIVAVDREGRVLLWNAAAEGITGVPSEEALGRTLVQALQRELSQADAPAGERQVSDDLLPVDADLSNPPPYAVPLITAYGLAALNCIWLAPPPLVYKVPELENLTRTGA